MLPNRQGPSEFGGQLKKVKIPPIKLNRKGRIGVTFLTKTEDCIIFVCMN
jgi:hypothetical protein